MWKILNSDWFAIALVVSCGFLLSLLYFRHRTISYYWMRDSGCGYCFNHFGSWTDTGTVNPISKPGRALIG
jgi:hypothetical protein